MLEVPNLLDPGIRDPGLNRLENPVLFISDMRVVKLILLIGFDKMGLGQDEHHSMYNVH
jgi:hypothetical protein